jgi:hypothetical protein
MCASRQSGKSLTAAALAIREALAPQSLVLLLSPSLRQSGELYRAQLVKLYNALGRPVPVVQESALSMTLSNGSRIISLPGTEETIRGYSSVRMLIIDEAARVADPLYMSVKPMLAVSKGKIVALSSAWAKLGWFYSTFTGNDTSWKRVKITADQCPRISKEFLRQERIDMGPRWYDMEYGGVFGSLVGSLFSEEDIERSMRNDLQPLFME